MKASLHLVAGPDGRAGQFGRPKPLPSEADRARVLVALVECRKYFGIWPYYRGVSVRRWAHLPDRDYFSWSEAAAMAGVELTPRVEVEFRKALVPRKRMAS